MAKELPYFKFFTSEWLNGDITLESYETQGLFINLCAYYWSKQGDLTLNKANKRFKGLENSFNEIIKEGFISINSKDEINIKFLDEQIKEREAKSRINSINGKTGGRPKKETPLKPILKTSNELKTVKGSTEREEQFNKFWELYNKKVDKKKTLSKFLKLKDSDIKKIAETIKNYISINNDVKYRKNPLTYLNSEAWNDEIVLNNNTNSFNSSEKVINLFNNSDLTNTIKKYKTNKENIKVRLNEFLEKESFKPKFKNRETEEVLSHFINSLEYNLPVKVVDLEAKRLRAEKWAREQKEHN